jgi:hypothetical protein
MSSIYKDVRATLFGYLLLYYHLITLGLFCFIEGSSTLSVLKIIIYKIEGNSSLVYNSYVLLHEHMYIYKVTIWPQKCNGYLVKNNHKNWQSHSSVKRACLASMRPWVQTLTSFPKMEEQSRRIHTSWPPYYYKAM